MERKLMALALTVGLGTVLAWTAVAPGQAVIETVSVGDAGNVDDIGYGGAVAYEYTIGKYEVTGAQYAAFLNAVAGTDTNGLYNILQSGPLGADIVQSGVPGSYTYAAGYPNRPVSGVDWLSAARFANWMHNGQPSGAQGASTTEDGAYDVSGGYATAYRKPGATWMLPTKDEWIKAGYYDPVRGGMNMYPTNDTISWGDYYEHGPTGSAPGPGTNIDNSSNAVGTAVDVGSYPNVPGTYGTFNQSGNVSELIETTNAPAWKLTAGSHFASASKTGSYLGSCYHLEPELWPGDALNYVGFRLVELGSSADDDGDGVPNNQDLCPDSDPCFPVDQNGCLDSDGDGVADSNDLCADTPPGTWVDQTGCAIPDTDGDGVFDPCDLCPGTPPGTPVDEDGCPDSDGDGVIDPCDLCPGTPPGTPVDEDGCADSGGEDIVIATVPVGNTVNAASAYGGAVDYTYTIGKYEITGEQYAAFLNAVADTDTNGLYNILQSGPLGADIVQSGSSGSYTYAAGYPNRPVSGVSWLNAARFANWMHNGQPTGAQDAGTTEDGVYDVSGGLASATRKPGATWAIPTVDEWIKAGYYDSGTGSYWYYPTTPGSDPWYDSAPVGSVPGPGTNINNSYQAVGTAVDVGSYPNVASPYRTFNQAGNVAELVEGGYPWKSTAGNHFDSLDYQRPYLGLCIDTGIELLGDDAYATVGFRLVEIVTLLDDDGDGVLNIQDLCPGSDPCYPVDQNGCPDTDGDGVADANDLCPGTPPGAVVDEDGCADSDGDGVADSQDLCPHTPLGAPVDGNGCSVATKFYPLSDYSTDGGVGSQWGDVNNDGYADMASTSDLWLNQGDGGFVRSNVFGGGENGSLGDYNNDGLLDHWSLGTHSGGSLYHNNGDGTWTNRSDLISWAFGDTPTNSNGSTCVDLNGDGYLDNYMTGWFNADSTSRDVIFTSYKTEQMTDPCWSKTWEQNPYRHSKGVTPCDFDEDGDQDLYVSGYWMNYGHLWRNDGFDGYTGLTDVTLAYGVDDGPGHTQGSCWADFNNDGHFDLFVANFAHPGNPTARFMENQGSPTYNFTDKGLCGITQVEPLSSGIAGDYDNDGDVDLLVTVSDQYSWRYIMLFSNNGDWTFTETTLAMGLNEQGPGDVAAWGDYNNDGYLDLIAVNQLCRNPGGPNHWLKVRLLGGPHVDGLVNGAAIGAQVRITVPGLGALTRQVEGNTGQLGAQNDITMHFGLGSHTDPVDLEIDWPNGYQEIVYGVDVDQTVTVQLEPPVTGPACWQYLTQCHGDSDDDGDVDTVDWPVFRDAFGYAHPSAQYHPCADLDHDGDVDTADWPEFRDNFGYTATADCTPGGTWPPAP